VLVHTVAVQPACAVSQETAVTQMHKKSPAPAAKQCCLFGQAYRAALQGSKLLGCDLVHRVWWLRGCSVQRLQP